MAAVDVAVRAPLYPGPDLVAYRDAIEAVLTARTPLYGPNDVVAYPELRARVYASVVIGGTVLAILGVTLDNSTVSSAAQLTYAFGPVRRYLGRPVIRRGRVTL